MSTNDAQWFALIDRSAAQRARAAQSPADLHTLADLLDANFEFVAQTYIDALDNDGGLQDVIDALRSVKA
jgi:hypothetical protein